MVTTTYGDVVGGHARMRIDTRTTTSQQGFRVNISAYLQMVNGGSSIGNYLASHSGNGWGVGSATYYHNIQNGQQFRVLYGGANGYYFYRQASAYRVYFYGAADCYWGTAVAGVYFDVPALETKPNAPKDPRTSNITATSIRFQFTSNGTGNGTHKRWQAQRATNSAFTTGVSTVNSTGTTTFSGLARRTRYYFRARGENTHGYGPWSSTVNAITLDLPDKPSFTLGTVTATSVAGSVKNGSYIGPGITERQTQLATNTAFTSGLKSSSATSMTFSSLARNTQYYVRTRVRNSQGWSAWSSTVAVRTRIVPPSTPSIPSVIDIASTSATVSGVAVSDNGGAAVDRYRIHVERTSGTAWSTTVESTLAPLFLTNLDQGGAYRVRIQVRNSGTGGGWSAYSGWRAFTMRNNVPTAPLNFAVTIVASVHSAAWTEPTDLLGSEIYGYTVDVAKNEAFGTGLKTYTVEAEEFSVPLLDLDNNSRYYARVRAETNNGPGSRSNVVTFTTGIVPDIDSSVFLRVAGTWRRGMVSLKTGGTWRRGVFWQRVNGVWRKH